MGSTGDRAASLIIGVARGACGGKRLRRYASAFRLPLIRIISNSRTSGLAVSTATLSFPVRRGGSSISSPTDAYDGTTGIVLKKQRLLTRVLEDRALIKPFYPCTLGDGEGLGGSRSPQGRVRLRTASDWRSANCERALTRRSE